MNILIVDDEINSRELLETLLNKYCNSAISSVKTSNSVDDALELINKNKVDLLFLDIEMPEKNGFDLLTSLNTHDFLICFATGYEKYAIRAINHGAFGYLLKPIDIQELKTIVQKAEGVLAESNQKSLTIKSGSNKYVIKYNDIILIEGTGNYTNVWTENKKILSSLNLSEIEASLPANQFFRVHKSYIINVDRISAVTGGRSGEVTLSNGQIIPVASRRMKAFRKYY